VNSKDKRPDGGDDGNHRGDSQKDSEGSVEHESALKKSIVWFALGMIATGVVGTAAISQWLDSKISSEVARQISSSVDKLTGPAGRPGPEGPKGAPGERGERGPPGVGADLPDAILYVASLQGKSAEELKASQKPYLLRKVRWTLYFGKPGSGPLSVEATATKDGMPPKAFAQDRWPPAQVTFAAVGADAATLLAALRPGDRMDVSCILSGHGNGFPVLRECKFD
jgi:hypothetical protein